MSIAVIVAGLSGRTGREIGRAVAAAEDLYLFSALGRQSAGRDIGEVLGLPAMGRTVAADLDSLDPPPGTVFVDFTLAAAARLSVPAALRRGMPAVVGTTGLSASDMEEMRSASAEGGVGAIAVSNFSLGAALVARLSRLAVEFFPDVEIVELHGAHKLDRPSGTAADLAAALAEQRPAGGAVPVHSVRLPGLVAHQEVLFGRSGETLTLRHDVLSREAYSAGALLAIRRVGALRTVVTRLEEVWQPAP